MAAPNIFQRAPQTLGGVFLSDYGKISFGKDVNAALVQSVNFTFRQTINRIYELGNDGGVNAQTKVYYVGGRQEGTMTIGRVIGPVVTVKAFYQKFGCVCKANKNTLKLDLGQGDCLKAADCSAPAGGDPLSYTLSDVVITQVGVTVAAQDMLINENVQMMFNDLEVGP